MCGIAGMIGVDSTEEICSKMLETMFRRGPDASGVYRKDNCCLLHSRLTVVDPAGGAQPMKLLWNNEYYIIVYNGELYNTNEIKSLLINLGHRFTGYSDTEVVLHAFAQWEENCLSMFNGIFSFAIWQEKRRKLFLARDRMGVKPLFYKIHNRGIIFASEIKTILSYPGTKAMIDVQGVSELILLGPGRTPGCGVFKDIFELEPGCYGYFAAGRWNWCRYWKLVDRENTDTFEEAVEKTRYLVTDAIKRQLVADVPVGTFLSGGLDSSLISSVCAEEMRKKGERLKTFSLDYQNNDQYFVPDKFQPESDNAYIRIMSDYIESEHSTTTLTADDLLTKMESAVIARDFPGMADVDSSLLAFCGRIKESVTVALSGECADEIFGGYPWYRDPAVRSTDGFPWAQNIDERIALINDRYTDKKDPKDYIYSRYKKTLDCCDILPETNQLERRMKEMMVLNTRWFMQTLLDRKDRMSMYCGLEVRVPFCDYRIAEYLYTIPWQYKDHNQMEKGLLRTAMGDYLPDIIKNRKKSPYPKSHDPGYVKIIVNKFNDMINNRSAPIFEIVNGNRLRLLAGSEFEWPWYGQLMKKPQTLAYMLQLNFWLKHYNVDILN